MRCPHSLFLSTKRTAASLSINAVLTSVWCRLLPVVFAGGLCLSGIDQSAFSADERSASSAFRDSLRDVLQSSCLNCHTGDEPAGEITFDGLGNSGELLTDPRIGRAMDLIESGAMPPADDEPLLPSARSTLLTQYRDQVRSLPARPSVFRPRRISRLEFRNMLRSVLGFEPEVQIIEAEQTVAEKSLALKLLTVDPPGESGFTNDTHRNPLTTNLFDSYIYISETAVEELFAPHRRTELSKLAGSDISEALNHDQAAEVLLAVQTRSQRRIISHSKITALRKSVREVPADQLTSWLKDQLQATLLSPRFLYLGLQMPASIPGRRAVDDYELAERLACFLWADIPDAELLRLAHQGTLNQASTLRQQLHRMLAAPGARSLAEIFATEWLTLNEIEKTSNQPPRAVALKTQATDLMNYLFTQARPLTELVDCRSEFINPHTARFYPGDSKQLPRPQRRRGIEMQIYANHRIELRQNSERGGILTLPGVLAMNRGPVIRGTWILERLLSQPLPEPPPDVGQVQPSPPGETLTFRERFAAHRSQASCASCHDRIDPLGFAFERFDNNGSYIKKAPPGKPLPDTSGHLPSGESFETAEELKRILVGSRKTMLIRSIVRRTLSYALARHLTPNDQAVVEQLTHQLSAENGSWHDLFEAIILSIPFRETIIPAKSPS